MREVPWAVLCIGLLAGCADSTSAGSGVPAWFIGAGDIALCGARPASESAAVGTSALIGTNSTAAVFTLGDNAYADGSFDEYRDCYGPTWGAFRERTYPTPGNHEYQTPAADGYFTYFGALAGPERRGYYSFDLGLWHIISLNSNIDAFSGSAQEQWLRADLAAHRGQRCTMAYWHHPVFSSSSVHGNDPKMADIWQTLQEFGADVVLSGHDHGYERFAPQAVDATPDARHGMREFVVGTGGATPYPFGTPKPNSEVRIENTFGVIRFALRDGAYDWEFLSSSATGEWDSGHALCNE